MSVKNNKEEKNNYWRHSMILENKRDFINYLINLTDINWFIDNLNNNQILSKLKSQSNVINDFINRVNLFIENEILFDIECYNNWKNENINDYVKFFIELIKEEKTYKNDIEINRFRKRMKLKRNSCNFILEYIYSFHNNQRKLVLSRLDKEYNKQEYLNLILIIMNVLLVYQFVCNLYGYEIEKIYTVDEQETINRKIKNLNIYSSMIELEIIFKWLNSILYQIKFICNNNGEIQNE